MSINLTEVQNYVVNLLNNQLDSSYVYHNLAHTLNVVEKAQELIEGSGIDEQQANMILTAAWFHDTGFTKMNDGHERESVKIATDYLKSKQVAEQDINAIADLILATEFGYEPQNELENIIRDADCAHLGSKSYEDYSSLLKQEWETVQKRKISDLEWLNENIDFLTQKHKFHSNYAATNWEKRKGKNLALLIKEKKKLEQDTAKLNQKKDELDFKKSKIELPERGIETMFRVALRNHITLSDIADTKANILLSVNAIIISMSLSTLLPKLDNPSNGYLIVPSIIFVLFTVISMILSVLATRPNVTQGKFTKEDVANKKVNLIFFGNFHKMKLNEFEWAMDEMMKDRDYLYGSLTKDLYFLGLVLNRKYNLLRTTYTVFMIGIIVSVLAFAIAFYMQEKAAGVVQTAMAVL